MTALSQARACHDCLKPTEGASRCLSCREARLAKDLTQHRHRARLAFPPWRRRRLFDLLAGGTPIGEAASVLKLSVQKIHGLAAFDRKFRRQLDDALMLGRNPNLDHGSASTYRVHGCRCPECRAAKAASGAWPRTTKEG